MKFDDSSPLPPVILPSVFQDVPRFRGGGAVVIRGSRLRVSVGVCGSSKTHHPRVFDSGACMCVFEEHPRIRVAVLNKVRLYPYVNAKDELSSTPARLELYSRPDLIPSAKGFMGGPPGCIKNDKFT